MSLPPGDKPESPVTPPPPSGQEGDESPKEKSTGKFSFRDTEPSSPESGSSTPTFIKRASTKKKSQRPKGIIHEGWQDFVASSSPKSSDSVQGRSRAMSMATSSEDHDPTTTPMARKRLQTLASTPGQELTDKQIGEMTAKFSQEFGLRDIDQVRTVVNLTLNEDEHLTLDALEGAEEQVPLAPPPEIQITPFEFDNVATCCNLKNPKSVLNRTIDQFFEKPGKLPSYEQDKLQRDCAAFLSTVENLGRTPPEIIQDLLLGYLRNYRTEAVCLMDASAAFNPGITHCTTFPEILKKLGLPESKAVTGLASQLENSCRLLSVSPYPVIMHKGYPACIAEVEECKRQLGIAYKKLVEKHGTSLTCLNEDVSGLGRSLSQYQDDLHTLMKNDFRSAENNMHSIEVLFSAALSLIPKTTTDAKQIKARENLLKYLEKAQRKVDFWPDAIARLLGCEKVILQVLKKADLDRGFEDALIRRLQEPQAKPIHKELLLRGTRQTYRAQLDYSPAACIRVPPPEQDPSSQELDLSFAESDLGPYEIEYNGKFCPSMARGEEDHCVGLVTAELKIGDEIVYDEIRLGVLYAFGVDDEHERPKVTARRWREALLTALIQKYPDELRQAMLNPGTHLPIKMDLFYDLLLSPDQFRDATGINDPELNWCKHVLEDVQQLNHRIIPLKVRDSSGNTYDIKVQPKIFLLITPCNELAFEKVWQVFKTWKLADEVLSATLTELFGDLAPGNPIGGIVARCLEKLPRDSAEYHEITELAFWIRSIFKAKLHHQLTADPMHFPNLLTELGRMLKAANIIGCKSAKDRTGNKSQSDIKMAFQCWENRKLFVEGKTIRIVPPPCLTPSEIDLFNACQLNLNSGQPENQIKSTGIPGSKMKKYVTGYAHGVFEAIDRRNAKPKTDWLLKG